MKNAPFLGRLIFAGFIWIFVVAALYVVLEGLGAWQALPEGLTRGVDVATGGVLVLLLVAHLGLATGRMPSPPNP